MIPRLVSDLPEPSSPHQRQMCPTGTPRPVARLSVGFMNGMRSGPSPRLSVLPVKTLVSQSFSPCTHSMNAWRCVASTGTCYCLPGRLLAASWNQPEARPTLAGGAVLLEWCWLPALLLSQLHDIDHFIDTDLATVVLLAAD